MDANPCWVPLLSRNVNAFRCRNWLSSPSLVNPRCFTGGMRRQIEWYSRAVVLLLFGGVIGYGIGAQSWVFVIVPVVLLVLLLLTGQFRLPKPPAST